jgi:uncharacterized protein (TIGR03083 family)
VNRVVGPVRIWQACDDYSMDILMGRSEQFLETALAFRALVEEIRPDEWELPGLGSWSIRSLVGHTSRAILTVESYLAAEPPLVVTVASAEAYYREAMSQFTDDAAIAARGVAAGVSLGENPVSAIATAIDRVRSALAAQKPDRIVAIGSMAIPLDEYLRTRTFELVVHSMDIANALGRDDKLPQKAVADTAALVARTAADKGFGRHVLFALTGRETLPKGFTVL